MIEIRVFDRQEKELFSFLSEAVPQSGDGIADIDKPDVIHAVAEHSSRKWVYHGKHLHHVEVYVR